MNGSIGMSATCKVKGLNFPEPALPLSMVISIFISEPMLCCNNSFHFLSGNLTTPSEDLTDSEYPPGELAVTRNDLPSSFIIKFIGAIL